MSDSTADSGGAVTSEATTVSESAAVETPTSDSAKPTQAKFKVKVDNQETEVSEEELVKGWLHAKAANERFQAAAAERKALEAERAKIAEDKAAAESMREAFKKDPWAVLSSLGMSDADIRNLTEDKLIAFLEQEQMSPEQKKAREMEAKLKEYEAKEADRRKKEEENEQLTKKQQEEQEFNQLKLKAEKDYEESFLSALEKSTLPKNPASIRRVAEKVYQSMLAGEEIPIDHAVRLAEHELRSNLAELVQGLDVEALEAFLGEETLKKVRKHDVSKLKNPAPAPKVPVKEESKAKAGTNSKYVDPQDFIKELKKKHGVL